MPTTGPDDASSAEHYFSESPQGVATAKQVMLTVAGRRVPLASSSGVFSADHVDGGTQVLLQHAPVPAAGETVLDLGCGYGPITCSLALREPAATVWAVDVNDRALELAERNARSLELSGVRVSRPENVSDDVAFDRIYSNPSIRIGKVALHEMLLLWLGRMRSTGSAYLVVHKHLGSDSLQKWLVEQGYPTTRVISVRGFRVLQVAGVQD